jgi:hypothetical protein
MSSLTRILNNQITNSTIIASQKIVAGSITGSLFASNVTVPGDFLITGNLFVLGTSAYTTIASTNTFVNDPLIVLNNGFAGTNTYDEGLIFNRGSSQNRALIWSEYFQEFRLIGTTETGTAYGNVTVSNYQNLHLGNLTVDYDANVTTARASGNITQTGTGSLQGADFAGNVALNGPYVTTSQGLINFLDSGVTTVNVFGAATAIDLGATTGTLTVNNPTVVGTQSTQNLYNTVATTLNFANAATTLNIGADSGTVTISNPTVVGVLDTQNLYNAVATTLNFAGAATTLNVGASTGTATINNQVLALPNAFALRINGANPTLESTATGTLNLFNANITTVNAFGAATDINIGATTGTANIKNLITNISGQLNVLVGTGSTTTGTGAVVVTGGVGISGNLNVGANLLVNGPALFNNTVSTVGISTFTNTTNSTDASGSTGALRIAGGASIAKDLWVGGNLYASNIFGVVHQVITVQDPLVYFDAANTYPYNYDIGFYSNFVGPNPIDNTGNVYQHSGIVRDNSDNTWKFFSNVRSEPAGTAISIDSDTIFDPIRAGNLTLTYIQEATTATTGALIVGGGAGIGGNIFHTGTQLQTSAPNYVFATTPTTVDAFKAATTLNVGANSGTLTIGNPTLVGTQTTQALYNTVTDTLNFARAANITMGHTDGTTTLQGNANVRAVTQSTSFTTGALVVAGGVGVASNVNIKGSNYLTLGKDIAGEIVYPENSVQITANANSAARISIQNVSTDQLAVSEFIASADNGSNVSNFIFTGITSSTFNSAVRAPIILPNDGYTLTTNNLVLSGGSDVVIAANGSSAVSVRVSASNSNVGVQYSTESTTEKTGAFTVVGGVGIGKDLYVGKGATLNSLRSTNPVQVLSSTSGNVAIFANVATTLGESTEYVVIGGGNTVVQPGVTLKVGSITTMMIPTGPTSGRPSSLFGNVLYDVQGMLRYNTTINNIEFFDGTNWQSSGSTFTVISDRQFSGNVAGGFGNVDGTNTNFTLQSSATTASTIISINGVMQFPTLAYSVTGSTLTFTEPPAPNDVIDARILTTTATVASIASGNGLNQFIADDAGAQIFTGTSATTLRVEVNPVGDIDIKTGSKLTYEQSAINIAANATPYVIATFAQATYTSAKYQIQVKKDSTNFQAMEALVLTDKAGNAYVTTYGVINNGTEMGTLSANVLSGNVNLWFTSVTNMTNANVKAFGTYII